MSDRVTVSIEKGVADVRLNRPDKLNALDGEMFQALIETGATLAADRSLRAAVLSGEGRSFCAGLDFKSFMGMAGGEGSGPNLLAPQEGSIANTAQRAAWVWNEIPAPVICAVHGVAYGGGLQIALGADIRLVAADAQLSVREIRWGLVPDMSGTQTLRRLVRLDVAKELTYTGKVVSGAEAVELGLATRVEANPRAAAFELARDIARRSPHAVRASKQLLNESGVIPVADGLALEERLQRGLLGGPNQIESIRSNMEKRDPDFTDPE